MADQGLFDKGTQTTRQAGDFVRINRAYAPNPSGRADWKMTIANFLAPENALIASNSIDISNNSNRITVLENGLTKILDQDKATSYQPTQNADSRIINFGFRVVSGSPTVAVGTGLGLDDIVTSRAITSDERSINVSEYSTSGRTLYITISGGTVDVATFSREKLYEL